MYLCNYFEYTYMHYYRNNIFMNEKKCININNYQLLIEIKKKHCIIRLRNVMYVDKRFTDRLQSLK